MENVRTASVPLACTLGPEDGPARLRRWQRLAAAAAPEARRVGHRLEVRYRPGPGIREELEDLAAAEARCCTFVAWGVTEEDETPVLHVTGDPATPEDIAAIAGLFGAGTADRT
jgi:hypothetical protein